MNRSIDASCFMPKGTPKHFVALDHDDPGFKYFLGELLLCFTCVHQGVVHELCYIHYLWPSTPRGQPVTTADEDGLPLETRYSFTPRPLYAIVSVSAVLYRAPLISPPSFAPPGPGARRFWVLNEDIYGNF